MLYNKKYSSSHGPNVANRGVKLDLGQKASIWPLVIKYTSDLVLTVRLYITHIQQFHQINVNICNVLCTRTTTNLDRYCPWE